MPPRRRNRGRRVMAGPSGSYNLRRATMSSPQFSKLILQSTILDQKLLLPEEFSIEFGDELSGVATLTVPNGCTWRVGIKKSCKERNMIWFRDGWHEFVEHYSIDFGYSLVFRYEGNSSFHVMIFNNVSGYQIEYPSDDQCGDVEPNHNKQNEDDTDGSDESDEIFYVKPFNSNVGPSKRTHDCLSKRNIERPSFDSPHVLRNPYKKTSSQRYKLDQGKSNQSELDRGNIPRKGKQKMNEMPCERYASVKQEDGEDFFVPKSPCHTNKRRFVKPDNSEKAIQAATMNKLKNPSFMVILKPHNINYMYVPADFSKEYLRTCSELITLEAPNGDQCIVSCTCNASKPSSSSSAKRIIKGWCGFFRENDLEEGDVCVFELINRRNIVLKVWIYRVADYAGR